LLVQAARALRQLSTGVEVRGWGAGVGGRGLGCEGWGAGWKCVLSG
jgi:hypothetical protein